MRAGPEPASANSLTHASTRPPPGTDLSPLQTVFSCSIQPLDPRNAKVALGAFDQFPPPSLNDCCRLGEATFAGMGGKEEYPPASTAR